MKRFLGIVFGVLFVLPMVAQEGNELCIEGALLFREDFGGNDPSDPAVGTIAVSGMSSGYQQIYKLQTSDPGAGMGAGCYLVAKRGYRNSTNSNYSVWHIMDDHTHFGDTTRGYLLEIDGRGSGNDVFYSTVIDDLCAGSRLTFSAYVANLTTAGQYNAWRSRNYVHPKLSFVLTHPETGAELARYNTDTISHDWNNYAKSWKETAEWQLIGMNFTVPEGVNAVRLSIRNNAGGSSTGNDFALDDIEIHLCAPPITIEGETEVCENAAITLRADFANDGTFPEPLEYKWWHSEDSLTWTELIEISDVLSIPATQKADSGWYKIAVAGIGNIGNNNCRAISEPFQLTVKECAPPKPELCTDGILLFREDFGGNSPDDPRVGQDPVQGMTYSQLLTDTWRSMGSGKYLVTKSGYCNGDTSLTNLPQNRSSQWHLQDDHTYPDDKTRGYLLEIDGRGDNAAFYTTTIDGLCEGIELTFSAYVANVMTWGMYVGSPGRYTYPRLKFVLTNPTSSATLATYDTGEIPFDSAFIGDYECWQKSVEWRLVGMNFTVPAGLNQIKLTIYNNTLGSTGNDFAIDDIEIHLCMTPDTIRTDTLVCDTISQILWREKTFALADTLRDTLRSSCGFDSIYYVMKVETEHCCPEVVMLTYDTLVCDTLLPFTWIIDNHTFVFEQVETQQLDMPHPKRTECIGTNYILTLDTFHCERLYPLIVNKYNWVLLLDNVVFARLFPERTARSFQWYKNELPITGANEDDYSEHNELHGIFQLRIELDNSRTIWSNVIELTNNKAEEPIRVKIYNSRGMPVREDQVTHGIYLYRCEQGENVWTEKRSIP